jgi:hypothetical protein
MKSVIFKNFFLTLLLLGSINLFSFTTARSVSTQKESFNPVTVIVPIHQTVKTREGCTMHLYATLTFEIDRERELITYSSGTIDKIIIDCHAVNPTGGLIHVTSVGTDVTEIDITGIDDHEAQELADGMESDIMAEANAAIQAEL